MRELVAGGDRAHAVVGDGGIDGGRMPLDGVDDPRIPVVVQSWSEAGAP